MPANPKSDGRAPAPKKRTPKRKAVTTQQIDTAYAKALAAYSARPGVAAIDKGFKYDGGKRTEEIAVRIHVAEKRDESVLEASEIFPKEIDGVPVDIIEAEYRLQKRSSVEANRLAERRRRRNPIQPGISVAHHRVTAGTFGAVVYDRLDGVPYLLSNWHVLVGNSGSAGDAVLQPGPADGGRMRVDTVAEVERWILNTAGDAAIARLSGSRALSGLQFESLSSLSGAAMPEIGRHVYKSGRTTGVTKGVVDGTGRYQIDYGGSAGIVAIDGFKVVPEIDGNPTNEELSQGGDSGSCWCEDRAGECVGVGLHFAGEKSVQPSQEHAIACYLPVVLDNLNVVLDPPPSGSGLLSQATIGNGSPDPIELGRLLGFLESQNRLLEALFANSHPSGPTPAMQTETIVCTINSRGETSAVVISRLEEILEFSPITEEMFLGEDFGLDPVARRGLFFPLRGAVRERGCDFKSLTPSDFEEFDKIEGMVSAIWNDLV